MTPSLKETMFNTISKRIIIIQKVDKMSTQSPKKLLQIIQIII